MQSSSCAVGQHGALPASRGSQASPARCGRSRAAYENGARSPGPLQQLCPPCQTLCRPLTARLGSCPRLAGLPVTHKSPGEPCGPRAGCCRRCRRRLQRRPHSPCCPERGRGILWLSPPASMLPLRRAFLMPNPLPLPSLAPIRSPRVARPPRPRQLPTARGRGAAGARRRGLAAPAAAGPWRRGDGAGGGGAVGRAARAGGHQPPRPPAAALGRGGRARLQGRLAPAGRPLPAAGHAELQEPRAADALPPNGGQRRPAGARFGAAADV